MYYNIICSIKLYEVYGAHSSLTLFVLIECSSMMCIYQILCTFQVGILQVLVRALETYIMDLRENEEEGTHTTAVCAVSALYIFTLYVSA